MTLSIDKIAGLLASRLGVDLKEVKALELQSANIHMHALGKSAEVTLRRATGEKVSLLSMPRWDLNWQRDFDFVKPEVFSLKDLKKAELTIDCTFANPRKEMAYGGFGSDDEMCFNFSLFSFKKLDQFARR